MSLVRLYDATLLWPSSALAKNLITEYGTFQSLSSGIAVDHLLEVGREACNALRSHIAVPLESLNMFDKMRAGFIVRNVEQVLILLDHPDNTSVIRHYRA